MSRLVPFALAALLATSALAQTPQFSDPANLGGERVSPRTGRELPIDSGTLGLEQLLRKLNTRASILNIVAHPDDEDGGMLTLYARGMGARVADLSLTRGEGGQNAMTGDFEDALGLLRTQELLANDRYTGVTQMFGTEVDFGFSKTKSEAFAKWTHERVLYDVVRAIRIYRPLVITATFVGAPTDGHGQHQVSGEIAQEAFVAAGDPNVFPELTKEGILPWKPLKMYARVPRGAISGKGLYDYATNQYVPAEFTNYITHQTSTTPPSTDIVIHEGTRDPLLTVAAANHADLPPTLATENSATELSYVQFARLGLGLQKSQIGPGVRNAPSGTFDVDYHLYGSRLSNKTLSSRPERSEVERPAASPLATDPNFFDGIDTSIQSIIELAPDASSNIKSVLKANLAFITQKIMEAQTNFSAIQPKNVAAPLADALQNINMLIGNIEGLNRGILPNDQRANVLHELRIKRTQLNQALILATGVTLTAELSHIPKAASLIAGSRIAVNISTTITNSGSEAIQLTEVGVSSPQGTNTRLLRVEDGPKPPSSIPPGTTVTYGMRTIPAQPLPATRPYFTRKNIEQPTYDLLDTALRNAPQTPAPLVAWAEFNIGGTAVRFESLITNTLPGGTAQPIAAVPPISVALTPAARVLPASRQNVTVATHVTCQLPGYGQPPTFTLLSIPEAGLDAVPCIGKLQMGVQNGWVANPSLVPWSIAAPSQSFDSTSTITPPAAASLRSTTLTAIATSNQTNFRGGYRPVGYGSLPRTNYFTPATTRIVPVDLNLSQNVRIAYLPGTGDAVPEALASIGLPVTTLTVADLTPSKLAAYDTVILGVRTYNAHPDLHGAPTQALLDFARNGGNVVVQYQTREFTAADAPYPLDLGSDEKVVDETSPVALLKTQNSLLTTPNKITPADFNNWIEERGHGFMSTWDPHYTALTETHDPGSPSEHVAPQLPQRGGLLTVQFGKGRWTYVAFALYRQLPEAVPGAYRLFLNLLDNPR